MSNHHTDTGINQSCPYDSCNKNTIVSRIYRLRNMKGVGNKRQNTLKLPFLRYSTGQSGMTVELFSRRSFIKILFSLLTISISRFRITGTFPEIYRKFLENFLPPTYTLTHPPISPTHIQPPKP